MFLSIVIHQAGNMQGKALKIVYERFYERFNWTIGFQLDNEFSRSEEHTSELQSRTNLVCRLLLEKKK